MAIGASTACLIFIIDDILSSYIGSKILLKNYYIMFLVCVIIISIQGVIFYNIEDKFSYKFKNKESDPFWKIKGILSLAYVLVPPIILIIILNLKIGF